MLHSQVVMLRAIKHICQFTAGQSPADDIQNRLLGLPTNAQLLADSIWEFTTLTLAAPPEDMRELRAAFGIFGSLPIIEINFDAGYILIDSITGQAAGPFTDDQPYDPVPLLLNHPEYESGTAASMLVAATGCEAVVGGKHWRSRPPPGYEPVAPVMVPCPTAQDPNRMCLAGPVPYVPPTPPISWPDPFYRQPLPEDGLRLPYPTPAVPGTTPATTPWRTSPGREGNPTDWVCEIKIGVFGPVKICGTITTSCAPAGTPCVTRIIICAFSTRDGPQNKHGRPPIPNGDYPAWPDEIDFDTLNGDPDDNTNPNDCYDRYYY